LKTEDIASSLKESRAIGDILSKDRMEFLNGIGPAITQQMTQAPQKLTAEKIEVDFSGIQDFEEGKVFVDVGEKCFGSFANFSCPETELEGVVVIFFPLSSTEILTKLLLKHYLGNGGKEKADSKMKLSAFKEATHILLAAYMTAIANGSGIKLQTSVPKFVCFRNFEFLRPSILRSNRGTDRSTCIGQFSITGAEEISSIKGLFISTF
jgi:chemotaxis protein CheY-P-specific phosphatase CheC